jgi:penicillin V acylase-like amidase (Ntn superfamily)
MPCLNNLLLVVLNDSANSVQLLGRKAAVSAQRDGIKPKLAGHSAPLDVYVRGLIAVKAVEKEAIGTRNVFDCWHCIDRYALTRQSRQNKYNGRVKLD